MTHLADFLVKQGIKRKAARSKAPTHLSKAEMLARLADAETALACIQSAANTLGRDAHMTGAAIDMPARHARHELSHASEAAYAIRDEAERTLNALRNAQTKRV